MRLHRPPPSSLRQPRAAVPRRCAYVALGLLFVLAPPSGAGGERHIFAEFGIATGGRLEVHGKLDIASSPLQVAEAVAEAIRFRAEHIATLERIGEGLGLTNCTALQYMAVAAEADLPAGEVRERLARMGAMYKRIQDRQGELSDSQSEAVRRLSGARAALAKGNLAEAETLIAASYGVAAAEDVEIHGDVQIGIPAEISDAMLAEVRRAGIEHFERLEGLSRRMGVTSCATANFLRTLGEKEVAVAELPAKLEEIALQHLKTVEQVQRITTGGPRIRQLHAEAARAFQNGDTRQYYGLLYEIKAIGEENRRETAEAATYVAEADARICAGKLSEMEYLEAARHCRDAAELVKAHDPLSAAEHLNRAGGAFHTANKLVPGQASLEEALELLKASASPSAEGLAISTRINLGMLLYGQGQYAKAKRSFERALRLIERARTTPERELEEKREAALNGLAGVEVIRNEHEAAQRHFRVALAILEGRLDPGGVDSIAMAAVLLNLGGLQATLGEYQAAKETLSRAVDVLAAATPRNDLALAVATNNLAKLYWDMKEVEEARRLWTGSHEVLAEALGEEHLYTVSVRFNLALIQRRLATESRDVGRRDALFAQAEEGLELALDIAGDALHENHPAVGAILNATGELRFAQGDLDDAADYFDQAIDIAAVTRVRDGEHLSMAGYLNNRAMVRRKQGRPEEAREDYEAAREILTGRLGTSHPSIIVVSVNLAKIAEMQERPDEAEGLLREALRISRTSFPPDHPQIIARLSDLARSLKRHGEAEASEQVYLEAIEATERAYGARDSKVGERLFHLCDLYDREQRTEEARVCFARAEAIFAEHLTPDHTHRRAVRIRLDRLSDASGGS